MKQHNDAKQPHHPPDLTLSQQPDQQPVEGVVLKRMKSFYYVHAQGQGQTRLCRIKGNLFQKGQKRMRVAVGDRVEVNWNAAEDAGWITRIMERSSKLSRFSQHGDSEQVLFANVEQLLIIVAIKQPPLRQGLIDRYIVTAELNNMRPVLVINKTDLAQPAEWEQTQSLYESLDYQVVLTSAETGKGLEALRSILQDSISALSGHSGVGKSTLLNALYPDFQLKTGSISDAHQRGRHTTTHAEMFPLPAGGFVVDTPGIRELGLYDISPADLTQGYVEFAKVADGCKFKACLHLTEPRCAVKQALQAGEISQQRYESYCSIQDSLKSQ